MRLPVSILTVIVIIASTNTWAQLPHPIDLADVEDGSIPGAFYRGTYNFGICVAGGGDLNGDGCGDFLAAGMPPHTSEGGVVAILGNQSGEDHIWIEINGIRREDTLGSGLSGVGDVNGDGWNDSLMGAYCAVNPSTETERAGEAYLLFGNPLGLGDGNDVDLGEMTSEVGIRIPGPRAGDLLGSDVTGIGDFNADGLSDFALGAPGAGNTSPSTNPSTGEAHLIFGSRDAFASENVLDLMALSPSQVLHIVGIGAHDGLGMLLSGAGDVNGDGFDDFLAGAVYHQTIENDPNTALGAAYLVYGTDTPIGTDGTIQLSALGSNQGVQILGLRPGDHLGKCACVGDFNGDGFDDIAVGAPASLEAVEPGTVYLIFGSPQGIGTGGSYNLDDLNGTNGFQIVGRGQGAMTGHALSGVGDVNGDGLSDLLIGAPIFGVESAAGYKPPGEVYLIYGSQSEVGTGGTFSLDDLDGINGVRFSVRPNSYAATLAGVDVTGVGDFNGDGIADIAMSILGYEIFYPSVAVVFGNTELNEATYRTHSRSGDAPPRAVGLVRDGTVSIPDSRCWIDYAGGSGPGNRGASLESVTLRRASPEALQSQERFIPAEIQWLIQSDRTGWASAEVTFCYLESEIVGPGENSLQIWTQATPSDPITPLPTTVDTLRNRVSAVTDHLGHFYLMEPIPPSRVTDLQTSLGDYPTSIHVTWTPTPTADSYEVWRGASANFSSAELIGVTDAPQFDDIDPPISTAVFHWVRSRNANLVSTPVGPAWGYAGSCPPVQPPTELVATDGEYHTRISVSWSPMPNATEYELWRANTDDIGSANLIATTSGVQWTDQDSEFGDMCHYWVRSANLCSASDFSESESGWVGEFITVPHEFSSVRSAVSNASDGDTILVSPGTYREEIVIDGLRVTIRAVSPEQLTRIWPTGNPVILRGGADVEFVGLTLNAGAHTDAILCIDSSLTLENCVALGKIAGVGGMAVTVTGESQLRLFDCHLVGGDGEWGETGTITGDSGGPGGSGLVCSGSVAGRIVSCELQGGDGGYGSAGWHYIASGGSGGHGLDCSGSVRLEIQRSVLLGGDGGGDAALSQWAPSGSGVKLAEWSGVFVDRVTALGGSVGLNDGYVSQPITLSDSSWVAIDPAIILDRLLGRGSLDELETFIALWDDVIDIADAVRFRRLMSSFPDLHEFDSWRLWASSISLGETQHFHRIEPANDLDWATFTIDEPISITARVEGGPTEFVLYLIQFHGNEQEILDLRTGRECEITREMDPGQYYLLVEDWDHNDSGAEYSLSLR